MKNLISARFIAILLLGCKTVTQNDSITSIKVTLPDIIRWSLITNETKNSSYIREWVPDGSTGDDTKWIIVEQKFVLSSPVSAHDFISNTFMLAKRACTDILYNGPDKMKIDEYDNYVGRFMCAQQIGKNYGTFTDQRVIAQGNEVYVITSELHIPPSEKAGVLTFQKDQLKEIKKFMEWQDISAKFVRDSVTICTNKLTDC